MPRIIEFEGRRIQVPDDATDQDIQSILGEAPPQNIADTAINSLKAAANDVIPAATVKPPEQPVAAPATPSWGEWLMGLADQGVRGVANGVVDTVGLPNTLSKMGDNVTNWGLRKAGVSDDTAATIAHIMNPIQYVTPDAEAMKSGIDTANNVTADTLGLEHPRTEPNNVAERYTGRIGEMLGGMAVPVGGALVAAEKLGVNGARQLPKLGRMLVEPAAVNPSRYIARESAMALGAGAGAATANQVVDRHTVPGALADLFGSLAGSGIVGLGSAAGRSAKTIFDAITGRPMLGDEVVNQAVTDRLAKAANLPGTEIDGAPVDTTPLVQAIENPTGERPSTVIPGYKESLSDVTKNPGVAALEYGRQQGQNAGLFTQRRMENNDLVDTVMRSHQPEATPGGFRDALVESRDRQLADAATGRVAAQDEVSRALGIVTPQSNPAQRGNTVRTALETERDAARARTEQAYERAATDGRMVDPAPLAETLDDGLAGLTETERGLVPSGVIDRVRRLGQPLEDGPQPTGILDASGNPITRDPRGPENIDLREATTLRSELQRLRAAALADPRAERGGRNAARVLDQMRTRVDDFISSNLSPEENTALDTAKATKFDEAERFTRQGDPVAEVLGRHQGGQPKVRDDMVAGKFVNDEAMQRLFAQADTPEVRSAIRDEVLSRADLSSPDRINAFTQQYGTQIDRFPGLRDQLTGATNARTAETAATTSETALQRNLGTDTQPGRGAVGKYLQYSDANSERAISEVLAAKDPGKAVDDLLATAGTTPQVRESARAAFWQKLRSESQSVDNTQRSANGNRAWRGDWLKSWLDDPRTSVVAEKLYSDKPEQLASIKKIADVLDNTDLRVRAKASSTSGTGQGVSNVLTPETIQSRAYAYMRGQVSGTYLVTSILSVAARRAVKAGRAQTIEQLTDRALLDPDLAKQLLKDNNPANRAALRAKTKGWLTSEGSTFLNELTDDDETKDAITREK